MGNSTVRLQSIVNFANTMGDLTPVLTSTSGFADEPALTVANDVMTDFVGGVVFPDKDEYTRFNWKWNRFALQPFYTNSWQQDYALVSERRIGWLEKCTRVDINNTQLPKPSFDVEVVRDLPLTSNQGAWPTQICWLYNNELEQGAWPGPAVTYTNPLGANASPQNPTTNIIDPNGNILVLAVYGVTGATAPDAGVNPPVGTLVIDGSCRWSVADPFGQGIRINTRAPQAGNVWLIRPFAQADPVTITTLSQKLDPIPDSYAAHFRKGFIAYITAHSSNPAVKARAPQAKLEWQMSVLAAARQGDRERENAGFYPTAGIMDSGGPNQPIGPAWPYPYPGGS